MIAGAMINAVILLIGDLIYDTNISVAGILIGALLAVVFGKIIEFFRFCVDYSRTEKVQFEDDEYYYYVKAVPKMSVAMSTKTVKKINTQRTRTGAAQEPAAGRPAGGREAARRSVMTERTVSGNRTGYGRTPARGTGKSVTIGNTSPENTQEDVSDDYEELF